MNKVFINGRVSKTPETRVTTTGKSVTSFSLAVTRKFKNANGDYEADFISCKAFGKTGEIISQYCGQGDLIGIDGSIRTGSYTDKNGNKRYTTDVVVESVEFLKKKNAQSNKQDSAENTANNLQTTAKEEDPFADFADEINIENDDYLE